MKNIFKALFKSRLFLFSLLGCLLFCLGIYLYTQWSLARWEASLSKARQSTSVDAETPNTQTSQQAQDGHWHTNPHTVVKAKPRSLREQKIAEMGLFSEEEKAAQETARLAFYESFGLEPPPPGYRYVKIGEGTPKLVKYKDPIISVAWGYGYGNYYQLTADEFAQYSCLLAIDDPLVIKRYELPPEAVELGLAWKQELYEKTKGPRPTITAAVSRRGSDPMTPEDKRALLQRMRDVEDDLLPPPPESFPIDYDVFDQIIAEIRATLDRR